MGREAFDKGEYRWGAELVNHLVFAQPDNQEAKNLQADILEQFGYQAEAGTWRNWYLVGASELRKGVQEFSTAQVAPADTIANMPLDLIFAYMGIQLDAQKANDKIITVIFEFPDINEKHTLFLENSVLNHFPDFADPKADVTVSLNRTTMNKILLKETTLEEAAKEGDVKLVGGQAKFIELMSCLVDLNKYFWFNMVTP